MRVSLENPRAALLAALTLTLTLTLAHDAHDHRVAFLELTAGDLRQAAIGEARR